jgi:hypothetical protein
MGFFGMFNRKEPTPEQSERLDRIGNPRQQKTILAAIRAGKAIPESAWSPLPESADVAGLIGQEDAQRGGRQGWGATRTVPGMGEMLEAAHRQNEGGSTFRLWSSPQETSLAKIGGEEGLKTLFAWGIVNPFGPTLTVVATDGILYAPGRKLPIVYLMLNPFQQEVQIVGEASIGQTWNSMHDLVPLFDVRLGSCPTLLLPSAYREGDKDVEFYANFLSRFGDGSTVLEKVRRFPGDPWKRVKEDADDARGIMVNGIEAMRKGLQPRSETVRSGRRLSLDEARELASNLLQPTNLKTELQAFLYAWKGSIEYLESQGGKIGESFASSALPLTEFMKIFTLLLVSCKLPEVGT